MCASPHSLSSSPQCAWLTVLLPLIVHFEVGYLYTTIHVETLALALLTVYSFTRTGVMLYQVCLCVCVYVWIYVYDMVCAVRPTSHLCDHAI